jgi:hypothetical protein
MHWIRPVGSALVLFLLMTSAAAADPAVEQPDYKVPSVKGPVAAQVSAPAANRMTNALSRLENLTGGHRVSAGVTPESQVVGVVNGRVVSEHWVNFHLSVGLFRDTRQH